MRARAVLLERWQRITPRERWLILVIGLCVLGMLTFNLVWQPMVHRLAGSERQYQQQLALAAQMQLASPRSVSASVYEQPLSLRVSESASEATLEIQQMDTVGDGLRVTLSGDALSLLSWLDRMERESKGIESLTLEKRNNQLSARVVLR